MNSDEENKFLAYWNRDFFPYPAEVISDDKTSLMTQRAFDKSPEYSTSCPSRTYEGKRWRFLDPKFGWGLAEYIYSAISR